MNGFRAENIGERDLRQNQRIAEATVDDVYNREIFGPEDFGNLALGGAPVARGRNGRWDYLVFPAAGAAASFCFAATTRKSFWVNGNLRIRLWYTGSVSSTNPFVFFANPVPLAPGGSIATVPATVRNLLPGPATTLLLAPEYVYTTLVPVNASHGPISVQLVRDKADAADTYAGDVYVLAATLEYIPARQVQ